MQQFQQQEELQQIQQENQFPQAQLVNSQTKQVTFNNNSEDFQLKISHFRNNSTQENKLSLILFSESELYEDLKFTSQIILEQEFKKQVILLSIFDVDQPELYSQNFYDLFEDNDYEINYENNSYEKQVNSKIDELLNKNTLQEIEKKVTENNKELNQIINRLPFESFFQKQLKLDQQIPEQISRFYPSDLELLKQKFRLLKEQVKLVQDPLQLLFLTTTVSYQNLKKLNPKHLTYFNVKNKSNFDFKKELQGQTNCLIIAKVKERENSEDEFYAGFAPDSIIFKEGNGCEQKTEQNVSYQWPYTLDLNLFVKRNLRNKDTSAYYCHNNFYFQFNCHDFVIQNEKNNYKFSYACRNDEYLSSYSEENKNRKMYVQKEMHKIEVEVIKLF